MALRFPYRVKATSSTSGTGTYNITDAAQNGYRMFSDAVTAGDLADGDTVPYIVVDTSVPNKCEVGIGTFHTGAPATLARTTVLQPGGMAVSWGAGTRDLLVCDSAAAFLAALNNLSDLNNAATARTNLGLGTAATQNYGTSANQLVRLDGSAKLPAVDGSQLTNLPGHTDIPAGSKMIFYQSAAPTGWTLVTTVDDYVIRITKGAGSATGLGGGVLDNSFGGYNTTYGVSVVGHALTDAEMGITRGASAATGGGVSVVVDNPSASAHTHTLSSPSTWRPPSAMCIIAQRN